MLPVSNIQNPINKNNCYFSDQISTMKIAVSEFTEGARDAKGLAVIIDVFRAFTVECYAIDAGAVKIIATGEINEAFELKKRYRQTVLVGERDEKKIEGFDFGNSPTELLTADLKGKTLIHTTTAGTNGLVHAKNAHTVLTGSFVNAAAVAKYIKNVNPDLVTLVAMGYRGKVSAVEDLLCAEYLKSLITGTDTDIKTKIPELRFTSGKRFFLNENIGHSPPTDFFLCTITDKFNFVLKAEVRTDRNIYLERIDV
jgi:2-phosphosulfolactate phosphatase